MLETLSLFSVLESCKSKATGANTGEFNFLPLFPEFDKEPGNITSLQIADPLETVGVNTPREAEIMAKWLNTNYEL